MKRKLSRTSLYLIIFGSFLLVFNTALGVFLTIRSGNAMKTQIESRMLDISNTAAAMIDGDELEIIQADQKETAAYRSVLKTLDYFQDNIELEYIYCVRDMGEERGEERFVFTIDPAPVDPGEFGEPVRYTEALVKAGEGTAAVDQEPYEDAWGRFISAYTPVFNSKGKVAGIVAVDFDAKWYENQISSQIVITLIVSVLSMIFGTLIVFLFAMHFRKRVRALLNEVDNLSTGIETMSDELTAEAAYDEDAKVLHDEIAIAEDPKDDEIVTVGNRIRALQTRIGRQIDYVRMKAYRDALTGVENRAAYLKYIKELDAKIEDGSTAGFTVAMFDVNGLKRINDVNGHENGDAAIVRTASALRKTCANGSIFRTGGDEFVVIFEGDATDFSEVLGAFGRELEQSNEREGGVRVTVAAGHAKFDRATDGTYQEVFVRADAAMYEDKNAYHLAEKDRDD